MQFKMTISERPASLNNTT